MAGKQRVAKFYGGPKDGDVMDFWDTDQRVATFSNALGEVTIYAREPERPGDDFIRFSYGDVLDQQGRSVGQNLDTLIRPQRPDEISALDEENGIIRQRVVVRLNDRSHEWELLIGDAVMETVPQNAINSADEAANWLRELGLGQ